MFLIKNVRNEKSCWSSFFPPFFPSLPKLSLQGFSILTSCSLLSKNYIFFAQRQQMAFLPPWISCSYCLWFPPFLFSFLVARFIQEYSNSLVPYENEKKYVCLLMNNGSVRRKNHSTTTEKFITYSIPFFIIFNNAIERLIQDVFLSAPRLFPFLLGVSLDPILLFL